MFITNVVKLAIDYVLRKRLPKDLNDLDFSVAIDSAWKYALPCLINDMVEYVSDGVPLKEQYKTIEVCISELIEEHQTKTSNELEALKVVLKEKGVFEEIIFKYSKHMDDNNVRKIDKEDFLKIAKECISDIHVPFYIKDKITDTLYLALLDTIEYYGLEDRVDGLEYEDGSIVERVVTALTRFSDNFCTRLDMYVYV